MTEVAFDRGSEAEEVWWRRWPPPVDEAVLEHGKAVGWLAAAGVAASVLLYLLHDRVLACNHQGAGECLGFLEVVDSVVHALAWVVGLATVPLIFLVYARMRHSTRRWRYQVPFEPRRRLLWMAVEEGRLPQTEFERVQEAHRELSSGRTLGERLHIRADFLWAWAVVLSVAGALVFVATVLTLVTPGRAAFVPLVLAFLVVGGAAGVCAWAARRTHIMAFDAGKWERHTAKVLLDRALDKAKETTRH